MLRLNYRLQRRTIGRFPLVSLAEARDATLAMQRKAAQGCDPRQPEAGQQSLITYAELIDKYTELHLTPNTRSGPLIRASLLNPRLRRFFTRPAASITKGELIGVIDEVMATGKAQAAVNLLRHLRMVFNWATDRDLLPGNPLHLAESPAQTKLTDLAVLCANCHRMAHRGKQVRSVGEVRDLLGAAARNKIA